MTEVATERQQQSAIYQEAKRLYDDDWHVLPVSRFESEPGKEDDKRPTVEYKRGVQDWMEKLDSWFRTSHINLAIVFKGSGVTDVECDSPEAEQRLNALFGGEIPNTPTYESSRGKHRWFRTPDGLPEGRAVIHLEGIEFRTSNGNNYSVIPPSVHESGKEYRWLDGLGLEEIELAELPDAVADRLRAGGDAGLPANDAEGKDTKKWEKGVRNNKLYAVGCKIKAAKIPMAGLRGALESLNRERCDPPLADTEVENIVRSAAQSSLPDLALSLLEGMELWRSGERAFATIERDGHKENHVVPGSAFGHWLSYRYYTEHGRALNAKTKAEVVDTAQAKAMFAGQEYETFVRVGELDDRIYLDLGDETWRAVEIDRDGWRIVEEPPVKFLRIGQMDALPEPTKDPPKTLREYVEEWWNAKPGEGVLIAMFMCECLRPRGPYPVLKLSGPTGSAKTMGAELLRLCLDPYDPLSAGKVKSVQDLWVKAAKNRLPIFDNLSFIDGDVSNAFCMITGGGGTEQRKLWSDDELFTVKVSSGRPVITTAIEDIGLAEDLVARSLMVSLEVVEQKNEFEEMQTQFKETARPDIVGALLNAVVGGLQRIADIEQPDYNFRLPKVAKWGAACEVAAGYEPNTFIPAYQRNQESGDRTALNSCGFAVAVMSYVDTKKEKRAAMTSEEWCGVLRDRPEADRRKHFPNTAQKVGQKFGRLASQMARCGYRCEKLSDGRGDERRSKWCVEVIGEAEEPPQPTRKKKVKKKPTSKMVKHLNSKKKKSGRTTTKKNKKKEK